MLTVFDGTHNDSGVYTNLTVEVHDSEVVVYSVEDTDDMPGTIHMVRFPASMLADLSAALEIIIPRRRHS